MVEREIMSDKGTLDGKVVMTMAAAGVREIRYDGECFILKDENGKETSVEDGGEKEEL